MKLKAISVIIFMMLSIINNPAVAQAGIKTDTFTVSGNCGQCKERIEEAAYIKGVKKAEWDKTTRILTIVYNADKTDLAKIGAAVARAGHDSKGQTAPDNAYKKLPECCAYRSGECHHE